MAELDYARPDGSELVRSLAHSGGIIVGAYLLALVFVSLGVTAIEQVTGLTSEGAPITYNVWLTVFQFLGFIGAAVWYFQYVDDDGILHWDWPGLRTIGWIVGGFVLLVVASATMSVILSFLGARPATNRVIAAGRDAPIFFLYMIPVAIFLVGPGEELIFRGVVQGRLTQALGTWPGILVASAVFGLVHWLALLGTGSGKLAYIVVAGMLGLVLGTVYEYSENILVPIAIHGVWNAMLFAANWYLVENGIPLPGS